MISVFQALHPTRRVRRRVLPEILQRHVLPGHPVGALAANGTLFSWLQRLKMEDVAFTGVLGRLAGLNLIHNELFMGNLQDLCQGLISYHSVRPASMYRSIWNTIEKRGQECSII